MLATIVRFLLFEKKVRAIFLKNMFSVFLFFLVFFVVISPNIVWNINNGWLTFGHTVDNAALNRIDLNFFNAAIFILAQAVMLGPVVCFLFFFTIKKCFINDFNNRLLLCFSFLTKCSY